MKNNWENYHAKNETVKYLEIIDENKIGLILNTDSNVCGFPRLVFSYV